MSGAQRAVEGDKPGGDTSDTGIEARARLMGWRPKEEFRGPAEAWRDAEEFIRRGEEELPVLRERARASERRMTQMQTDLSETKGVLADFTERFRTADERAYKRARADLEKERLAAIEAGDVPAVRRIEGEVAELDEGKPKPSAEAKRPAAVPPAADAGVHPDAVAWGRENGWYYADQGMRDAAMGVHQSLLVAEPDLSLRDNLARVTATIRTMFPGRVPEARRAPAREEDDENERRNEPAAVGSGREGRGGGRPKAGSFDAMPADSKAAFARYSKSLDGKGKPLTKEEWAVDYWAQFEGAS